MGKFAETMRWLSKDVQPVAGKKDKILNPCTFITGTVTTARFVVNCVHFF